MIHRENPLINQKDWLYVVMPSVEAHTCVKYSPKLLLECVMHLLTEMRAHTLVLLPEHSDSDLSHVFTGEFVQRTIDAGYTVKPIVNKLVFTR